MMDILKFLNVDDHAMMWLAGLSIGGFAIVSVFGRRSSLSSNHLIILSLVCAGGALAFVYFGGFG